MLAYNRSIIKTSSEEKVLFLFISLVCVWFCSQNRLNLKLRKRSYDRMKYSGNNPSSLIAEKIYIGRT